MIQVYGSWSRYMAPGLENQDSNIEKTPWDAPPNPQPPTSSSDLVPSDRFNIEMPIFACPDSHAKI